MPAAVNIAKGFFAQRASASPPTARETPIEVGGFCHFRWFGTGWTAPLRPASAAWIARHRLSVSVLAIMEIGQKFAKLARLKVQNYH